MKLKRICLVPRLRGVGGMVSFQAKFASGLEQRGLAVSFHLDDQPYDRVLVIGGTRNLPGLWHARRRGIPVIQRLDGMNWIHKRQKTGWRHYLRAEYGNLLLAFIRARLADGVVYQSQFVKDWWERARGPIRTPSWVVHNGVDLSVYTPGGLDLLPEDRLRILMVEGNLMGGYEHGLEFGMLLASGLASSFPDAEDQVSPDRVELMVVGKVSPDLRARWQAWAAQVEISQTLEIRWTGQVQPEEIPLIDRSAHLMYSSDLNAACPNAVIEALACGTPVLAFDTGALSEIVGDHAGRVVPYGSDPWQLDPPDIQALLRGAGDILSNLVEYRTAARKRAEAAFSLETMVDGYLQALNTI